jgi:hypothetical protein
MCGLDSSGSRMGRGSERSQGIPCFIELLTQKNAVMKWIISEY